MTYSLVCFLCAWCCGNRNLGRKELNTAGCRPEELFRAPEIAVWLSARLRRVRAMSVSRAPMSCSQCGYRASQWRGRCPQCGAWDSFVREAPAARAAGPAGGGLPRAAAPVALAAIEAAAHDRLPTRLAEFDRVLGGGLVRGSVVLLAGEP